MTSDDTYTFGRAGGLQLQPDKRRLLLFDVFLVAEDALAVELPGTQVEGVATAKRLEVTGEQCQAAL